jgi:hypothetical protein
LCKTGEIFIFRIDNKVTYNSENIAPLNCRRDSYGAGSSPGGPT